MAGREAGLQATRKMRIQTQLVRTLSASSERMCLTPVTDLVFTEAAHNINYEPGTISQRRKYHMQAKSREERTFKSERTENLAPRCVTVRQE